ncbi:hypothetical protein FOXYS1_14280 [Fusarium oxysporum]|uniref:Heterokaryon incompatibility domain-containing protein n=1 Tax=Fusarium oxysporum TaxID=5507 RepID=A0A8H5ECH1_FUSOX|nr:hypothetical protein FOXYS1_14280 [Fusarium oxysporum]
MDASDSSESENQQQSQRSQNTSPAPSISCRFCYADPPCKQCQSLEFYELREKRDLNFLGIKVNAESCKYCSILYDGMVAVGWPEKYSETRRIDFEQRGTLILKRSRGIYQEEYGLSARLEFFTVQDTSIPTAIGRGNLVPDFFTEKCKTQIEFWIGEPGLPHTLPKRVLSLGMFSNIGKDENLDQDIRLMETQANQHDFYVALSHCWVGRNVPQTTQQNLKNRLDNIPYSELSPIFQDAVRVCRYLGVQYLWIDSLCIIQRDQDDWESQADKMADIYQNALFTIAVQFDDENGFIPQPVAHKIRPQTGDEAAIYVREIESPQFLNQTGVFFRNKDDVPSWIHARATEVMYESSNTVRCQCGNHNTVVEGKFGNPRETIQGWKTIVSEYTQRALSQHWDLLPGLAGIARRFQEMHQPGDYIAGLWSNQLIHWLCWKSVAQYTFKNMQALYTYEQMAEVREVLYLHDSRNPFGRVRQARLLIAGFCQRFYIYSTVGKDRKYVEGCDREFVYICDAVTHVDICMAIANEDKNWFDLIHNEPDHIWFDARDDIPMDGTEVTVLQMFQSLSGLERDHVGLVLVLKSVSEEVYRRIGLVFLNCQKFAGHYDLMILE